MSEVMWIEKLDSIIKRFVQTDELRGMPQGYWLNSRHNRIKDFHMLLKLAVEHMDLNAAQGYGSSLISKNDEREIRWAWEQFTSFDYKLIELCYGQLSQHIYIIRYSREMQKKLNDYLVNRNVEALDELFTIALKIHEETPKQGNRDLLDKIKSYEDLVETAWAEALLISR